MRLTTKMAVALVGVLVLAVLSSALMLLSSRHLGSLMDELVVQNLSSVRAAEGLEIALLEQRGYTVAYIVDEGNPVWLDELERRKPSMVSRLARARETARSPGELEAIDRVADAYQQYDGLRSQVVSLYDSGRVAASKQLALHEMGAAYDRAYLLCKELIAADQRVTEARLAAGHQQLRSSTYLVGGYVVLVTGLSLWLAWLFAAGIYKPLRRLAREARGAAGTAPAPADAGDIQAELRAVGNYLNQAQSDLAHSREQLLLTEKLASVGKLAAGVAHEIRNPLTSLSMRLFTLKADLGDDPRYQEDLRVVTEEIGRLDGIVCTYLEFARPRAIQPQKHRVSGLLDKTLELCLLRLGQKGIRLLRDEQPDLPEVLVDGEQIRQVFINLILNAVEAVPSGGQLRISSSLATNTKGHSFVRVRFHDSGPGIPEEVRCRIFEPFFTTKETGTGLGLSIAASIMVRHGGRLELEPVAAPGTAFAVWLPTAPEEGG
jgi:signal transduction histidine kinase